MSESKEEVPIAKKFGPGMWYTIHITALKLGQDLFENWIRITLNSIPCLTCRKHAVEYLEENPLLHFKDVYNEQGDLIGYFQWTWLFHNAVNQRLNKKIFDFNEAYTMYMEESMCSDQCGN
jgi:hypothetical protein